jgi:prepilin-type N-terminal cleavage/methylation domain-containing protein
MSISSNLPHPGIKKNSGFTLIELMVVIAIIGILSSVSLTSLNAARKKARDTVRRTDLEQILLAFEQYQIQYGTYLISGAGSGGGGEGWFNYEDVSDDYPKSIAHALQEEGYFNEIPLDPLLASDDQIPQYMVYATYEEVCIYAQLESPGPADYEAYEDSKNSGCYNEAYYGVSLDTYDMNYAKCTHNTLW